MKPGGNHLNPVGISNEKLFYSPAFVKGFSDVRAGRPFKHPDQGGPLKKVDSAHRAYERGRQFAVLWSNRPITNLTDMKDHLLRYKNEGIMI